MTASRYSPLPPKQAPAGASAIRPASAKPPRPCDPGEFWFDGHHVRVKLLTDGRIRTKRSEDPSKFDTPFHRLVYRLRTLLGLEGGRAWIVSERQGRALISMAMARDRWNVLAKGPTPSAQKATPKSDPADGPAAMLAEPVARVQTQSSMVAPAEAPGAESSKTPVVAEPQAPTIDLAVAPPLFSLARPPAHILEIIRNVLSLDDRLSLAAVCRGLRDGMQDGRELDLRLHRLLHNAEVVCTLSGVVATLLALGDALPGVASRPLSVEQRAEVLLVLARRLSSLAGAQRMPALAAVLKATEPLDCPALTASVLEVLAITVREYRPCHTLSGHDEPLRTLYAAIKRLPLNVISGPYLALTQPEQDGSSGLHWDILRSTSIRALLPVANADRWLALVAQLPQARRRAEFQLLLEHASGTDHYADLWHQQFRAARTLSGQPEFKASVLSALAAALPGEGRQMDASNWGAVQLRTRAWGKVLDEARTLAHASRADLLCTLAISILELSPESRAASVEAMRVHIRYAALAPQHRIRVEANLLGRQTGVDPAAAWSALWADSQAPDLEPEQNAALGVVVLRSIWCSPQLAGWQCVVQACRTRDRLQPRQRAELLATLLRAYAVRERHAREPEVVACGKEALEAAFELAEREQEPRALVARVQALDAQGLARAYAALELLAPEDRASWFLSWLELGKGPHSWMAAALEAAEREPLAAATRASLIEAFADRCDAMMMTSEGRVHPIPEVVLQLADALLSAAERRVDAGSAGGPYAAIVQLGNSMSLSTTLRREQQHLRGVVTALQQRIWNLAGQLRPDDLAAMFAGLFRRKSKDRGVVPIWATSTITYAVMATRRLPAYRTADILAQLVAGERRSNPDHGHFALERVLLWDAIRVVPSGHQARVISELGGWFSTRPVLKEERPKWTEAKAEFDRLCTELPDVDKAALSQLHRWHGPVVAR